MSFSGACVAVNPQVPGSSPGRGAKKPFKSKHLELAFNLTYQLHGYYTNSIAAAGCAALFLALQCCHAHSLL